MSYRNMGGRIAITGSMPALSSLPCHVIFAINTPPYDTDAQTLNMRGFSADGYEGYHTFSFRFGGYAAMRDRGYNYGAPLGADIQVDPGYNLDADGRSNLWTWVWVHINSTSLRGFRVHNSQDFTAGGTFTDPAVLNSVEFGAGLPAAAKVAHLHFLSALTVTEFNGIIAGTVDPAGLPALIDGFRMRSDLTSVNGLLSATAMGTAPVLDTDNPVVPNFTSGGAVEPGTGSALRGRRVGGFGW